MTKPKIIAFYAPLKIEAAADGQPRRFKVQPAYAGGALRLKGFDLPVVVDLAGMKTTQNVVANLDHDSSKRVGHVTEHTNDGRQLLLAGIISAASAAAEEFTASASNDFPWAASIEASADKVQQLAYGERAVVNGQSFTGPMLIVRKSNLYGVAFLSKGADASARAMLAQGKGKGIPMKKFKAFCRELGFDPDTLTPNQRAGIEANYRGEHQASGTIQASGDPLIVERDRIRDIEAVTSGDWGSQNETVADLKAQAIDGTISYSDLRAGVLKALRDGQPQAQAPYRSSRDGSQAPKIIEAALCQSIGMAGIEKQFSERELQTAHEVFHGRLGLQEVLIQAAHARGFTCRPGERVSTGNLREILAYALPSPGQQIHAAGDFSSMSAPGILSNVANKFALIGWQQEDQAWRAISIIKPTNDFKLATSYRLLDDMSYEQVGPSGEIKHGSLGEESYTRQVNTYAKMFSITRRDIINDDMGVLSDVPMRLGRGSAKKLNEVFWPTFMNNSAFFTSGRGNYISGATTNLATDGVGLQLALLAFRALRTSAADGAKRIGGKPAILLVPPELEFAAQRLYQSTNIVGTATTPVPDANIFHNLYKPVVSNWLSDTSLPNYSATAFYLLRDPTIAAAICVSFLNGMEAPVVQTAVAEFNTLGIEMRGYHDFGCDKAEYLAGIMSKGAA